MYFVLPLIAVLLAWAPVEALKRPTIPTGNRFRGNMQRDLVPQLFAAGAAGALIFYVATNIDSIREQQKVAIDQAMTEQSTNVKSAQEKQRAAIEAAQAQQAQAGIRAKQAAEEARKRAER
jgi:hypothetical protein